MSTMYLKVKSCYCSFSLAIKRKEMEDYCKTKRTDSNRIKKPIPGSRLAACLYQCLRKWVHFCHSLNPVWLNLNKVGSFLIII